MRARDKKRMCFGGPGIFAVLSGLVLTACGEAPPKVTPVPKARPVAPPAPSFTASITQHPVYSLVGESRSAPDCPVVPDQKWPALVFEPFPLPPGTRRISEVVGYNERDVWLLEATGQMPDKLLHWDGVSFQEEPVSGCQSLPSSGELLLGPGGLLIAEENLTETETYYEVLRRSASGSWVCDDRDNDARFIMVGESELRLPIWKSYVRLDGRLIPTPFPGIFGLRYPRAIGTGADDFWVYSRGNGSRLAHWNGMDWEHRMPALRYLDEMAVDRQGDAWLLGRADPSTHPEHRLLRWSRDNGSWACLSVPSLPALEMFLVGSDTDIWFIGRFQAYHWNGAVFQAGPLPIKDPSDAWLDADGTLWIAGATEDHDGVVFRSRRGEKP